ncbi:MAG: agmatinase [Rhodospirillales bacterium]|nr:agmatinase [Rhodospirillales bacterium]
MQANMRGAPGRYNAPYQGVPTFLRQDYCDDISTMDADIAILGVPTDEGSPFMGGSRFAPRSIREHSLRFGSEGYYNVRTDKDYLRWETANRRIVDVGDSDVLGTGIEQTFGNITDDVAAILERGAMPVTIGGDHAITYPVVRAFREPIHVLHFDAHMDYQPFVHGLQYTNGHPFRQIKPLEHVLSLTQIGIRSLRSGAQEFSDARADGSRIVTMGELDRLGPEGFVFDTLPRGEKAYVSIDVDVYDMTLVPGCVSAEPGGVTYQQLRDMLQAVSRHMEIVGFDFVEVNPQLDVGTGVTSYLGAHTVVEFLGAICEQPWWHKRTGRG